MLPQPATSGEEVADWGLLGIRKLAETMQMPHPNHFRPQPAHDELQEEAREQGPANDPYARRHQQEPVQPPCPHLSLHSEQPTPPSRSYLEQQSQQHCPADPPTGKGHLSLPEAPEATAGSTPSATGRDLVVVAEEEGMAILAAAAHRAASTASEWDPAAEAVSITGATVANAPGTAGETAGNSGMTTARTFSEALLMPGGSLQQVCISTCILVCVRIRALFVGVF